MSLENILNYLSLFSGLFPVIAAIYRYRTLSSVLRLMAIFFFISALVDTLLLITPRIGILNNAPLIHGFTVVIVIFFGIVYYRSFYIPSLKKITLGACILAFAGIIYGLIIEGIMSFPSFANSFLSVVFTLLSLLYFYQLLNAKEFVHIESQPMFWINSAVLFYFGINIFLFMLFDKFFSHSTDDVWIIHDLTNVFANIFYSIGLLCQNRRTKTTLYRY
ncbi:MAG: hypothetical protein ACTHMI_13555 [Mucilaginibacter sp.]